MIRNFVGGAISWLNPNDIENITVLKDAVSMANDSCGQQIMRVRRKQIRSIWMDRVIRFLQMRFIEN